MPKIFFTSDQHFGHKNVIRYDNRPFTSVEDMDEALIRNWNAKVTEKDTVYVLGDISWYNDETTATIFNSLKGHKILIKGNHDRVHGQVRRCFDEITDYMLEKMKEYDLPLTACESKDKLTAFDFIGFTLGNFNLCAG